MKKVLFLLVSIVILGLVFAGCGGITNITAPSSSQKGVIPTGPGTLSVISDEDVMITKVYNKAGGVSVEVPTSQNAVRAWEPDLYPDTYPVEPAEATDSTWDDGVDWFEDDLSSAGADWIWETHVAEGPADYEPSDPLYDPDASISGRVVLFETTFDVPGTPTSATLRIAADNGYEAWVNVGGTHHLSPTVGGSGWENSNLHQSFLNTTGWQAYGTIIINASELVSGSNTLYVLAGNEYFWGDDSPNFNNPTVGTWGLPGYKQYNPGAVIFQLDVAYEEGNPCIEVVKDCPPEFAFVDDTLTYNYTVTNTGDGALLDVTLVDDQLGLIALTGLTDEDLDGEFDDLAEGASATGTAVYVVLEGDTVLLNTATASSISEIDCSTVEDISDECMVEICYDETAWADGGEGVAEPNNEVEGNKSSAWGWTNEFEFTENFVYMMPLYAAAGQNDTSKGFQVGTVTVVVGSGCVTVTYNITEDTDYQITEAHLWVGNTPLPIVKQGKKEVPTSAPGQFPYSPEIALDGKSATWGPECSFESPIWVAAHAVIEWCGLPELQ